MYVVLEINNKHANVSLLTLVANNMERQQLPTGVVFQSRVVFYLCWFSSKHMFSLLKLPVFVYFSHRLDLVCLKWVDASLKESPLLRRSWQEIWTLSSPVRSATTRSHVMSKCTYNCTKQTYNCTKQTYNCTKQSTHQQLIQVTFVGISGWCC